MPFSTTYQPLPISFTAGNGVWLYTENGDAYLDSFSGIGVNILGHAHPNIIKIIHEQSQKPLHVSNGFLIPEQNLLAEKLLSLTQMDQIFFANSGCEANETALKLTRLFARKNNISYPEVIVMKRAFHGRSIATISASGNPKIQDGFEPLTPGFIHVPMNDIDALQNAAQNSNNIVAIMLEPIQGEGGVHCATQEYIHHTAQICEKNNWMLIFDEVQTGNGRTGNWYAFMDSDVKPDVITTAKGLANGIPIGACLMRNRAKDLFKPGNHGSTFGGNPFACAVGLTVLNTIEQDSLLSKTKQNSLWFKQELQQSLGSHPLVKDIRGKGYMIGIELNKAAHNLKQIALTHKLLVNITSENIIRVLPSLIIEQDELRLIIQKLKASLDDF